MQHGPAGTIPDTVNRISQGVGATSERKKNLVRLLFKVASLTLAILEVYYFYCYYQVVFITYMDLLPLFVCLIGGLSNVMS